MTAEPARTRTTEVAPETTAAPEGQLRLVIVGHVDHGKSTLIGRLLHDTGSLREGQLEHLQGVASRRGMAFEFANLTDALQAERDQNVTIDTAQVWLRTPRREYVLIDAPGHEEFLKNMVTGAARADAALVVIDAREGVQDQSRRHGHLLKLLGIEQVAVIVNKLDLVGYSEDAFARVAAEYCAFLGELGLTPTAVIPVSASLGENVARPSAAMPWHTGGTILDVLDTFTPIAPDEDQPLRFPIQAIYRFDHRRVMAGRIESGTLRVGDRLMFLPSRKQSTVRTIEQWNAPARLSAGPGKSIGITIDDPLFLARGEVGCRLQDVGSVASRFTARVFWLGRVPLTCGRPYKLKLATQEIECEIHSIARVVDASSLDEPHGPEASAIGPHEVGDVTIHARRPIALDRHQRVPHLGRFVLVDGYDVAGGGIVLDTEEIAERPAAHAGVLTPSSSQVAVEARHLRNGHAGAVVWFTGLSGSGKSTIARAIERELFERGWQVVVLDGDNLRTGLNSDLGFSDADRAENIRRVAEVAKLFAQAGVIAVTALISPTRRDRLRARAVVEEAADVPFLEVHLSTPLACCEERDPKGLYARARRGEIPGFTGVSAPFEAPDAAELTLDTSRLTVAQAMDAILDRLTPAVESSATLR